MNIQELKDKISELPSGGITVKKIKNKNSGVDYEYHVYQWRENGKQKSRYLHEDETENLSALIEERKKLEEELAEAEKNILPKKEEYFTEVKTGEALRNSIKSVLTFRKREIIKQLETYVFGNEYNRVFIVYGLRRTGKTTMMKQVLAEMNSEQFEKAAYIQINPSNNLGQLNRDLKKLEKLEYRYIFIDEVTLM